MTPHISHVKPFTVLGPDTTPETTRDFAQDLVRVSPAVWNISALREHLLLRGYTQPDSIIQQMADERWIFPPQSEEFCLTYKIKDISQASSDPRMTVDEAGMLAEAFLGRLIAYGNSHRNGTCINSVGFFGSILRDPVPGGDTTIGDLDIAIDFGFEERYDPLLDKSWELAKSLWQDVTGDKKDNRLSVQNAGPILFMFGGYPDSRFMTIWRNSNPLASRLSTDHQETATRLEEITLRNNERARLLAARLRAGGRPALTRRDLPLTLIFS